MAVLRPAFLAGLFVISVVGCSSHDDETRKRPVVTVNEESLSLESFADLLAHELKGLDALAVKDPNTIKRAKNNVIRSFISEAITKSWAKKHNIFVRKELLDAEITTIRNYYPDDLAFRRALAEQSLSFDSWKEKIRLSLLQKLIIETLSKSLETPTEQELLAYYNNHKEKYHLPEAVDLYQIVLKTEVNAERIAKELKKGKSFNMLARKYSISPEAEKDGQVGWVEKGTLEVFDKAFKLRTNKHSEIIKSPYGYHILMIRGKRGAKNKPFQSVKEEISSIMTEKKEQAKYAAWLEKQIRDSKVFKDEDLISSVSVVTRRNL